MRMLRQLRLRQRKGYSETEIAEMTQLVKDAIGFDIARGDTVSLKAVQFLAPPVAEPLPEPPIWQQPWVWDIGKQVLGGLFILLVLFTVIRPAMKNLMKKPSLPAHYGANADGEPKSLEDGVGAPDGDSTRSQVTTEGEAKLLAPPGSDADVEQIQKFVQDQPKVSAQIVKGWVAAE